MNIITQIKETNSGPMVLRQTSGHGFALLLTAIPSIFIVRACIEAHNVLMYGLSAIVILALFAVNEFVLCRMQLEVKAQSQEKGSYHAPRLAWWLLVFAVIALVIGLAVLL